MTQIRIIAGFPGVGKSSLAKKYPDLVTDLDSGLFGKDKDGNKNENWLEDYYQAIIKQSENKVILTSTHKELLEKLQENDIPFAIVIPDINIVEEYLQRYKQRGSNEEFIQKIYEQWDGWINKINNMEGVETFNLPSGVYLSDIFIVESNPKAITRLARGVLSLRNKIEEEYNGF